MAEGPWLTIIGLGEDGPAGLPPASVKALAAAEIIIGAVRHIDLLGPVDAETRVWPVPFADGLPQLDALRGTRVVVLASGDPFWFGAGSVIVKRYDGSEWQAIPAPSVFSLAAARLGWPLETTGRKGISTVAEMLSRGSLCNLYKAKNRHIGNDFLATSSSLSI